ncbi:hypothetical protein EVAR_91627_1 [Eumeta japonica]|uniref:Uncharacterized protein n=1 Tax=Eumeta variegata TaxID=151549 RepID=A0A4C1UXZ6_EUMVA|nr:hypothetical protein EVAR_91627_1 [Eumeta japonica]
MHRNHLRLEDRTQGIEPERRVPGFFSVLPLRQGCTDFVYDSASVGINMRPDHCETVQNLTVQVLDALIPDLGQVRRVRQVAEIYELLELLVNKSVRRIFSALHFV